MMKKVMMVIVMLGFIAGCSNSQLEPADSEWPGTTQGRGHYFNGEIDNNAIPYLSPNLQEY